MDDKMESWRIAICISWLIIGILSIIDFDTKSIIIWFAVAVIILLCFENKEAEKK